MKKGKGLWYQVVKVRSSDVDGDNKACHDVTSCVPKIKGAEFNLKKSSFLLRPSPWWFEMRKWPLSTDDADCELTRMRS